MCQNPSTVAQDAPPGARILVLSHRMRLQVPDSEYCRTGTRLWQAPPHRAFQTEAVTPCFRVSGIIVVNIRIMITINIIKSQMTSDTCQNPYARFHMSYVICHMRDVLCHMPYVICLSYVIWHTHRSYVICHMSYVICHMCHMSSVLRLMHPPSARTWAYVL